MDYLETDEKINNQIIEEFSDLLKSELEDFKFKLMTSTYKELMNDKIKQCLIKYINNDPYKANVILNYIRKNIENENYDNSLVIFDYYNNSIHLNYKNIGEFILKNIK